MALGHTRVMPAVCMHADVPAVGVRGQAFATAHPEEVIRPPSASILQSVTPAWPVWSEVSVSFCERTENHQVVKS